MHVRAVLLVLCGTAALGSAPPQPAVTIDNFRFAPAEIVVPVGATVTWTNRDDIPHTVTSALFRSPPLDTDEQFSHRFDQAGRFAYFCSLHAHMQGVVLVQ